jgi:hypothetical protein
MTLISIGDQVGQGIYAFHSRFRRAVNFRHGDLLISVVDEEIGDGPLNIVVRDLDTQPTGPSAAPLRVAAHEVVFENRRFDFTDKHSYRSTIALDTWNPDLFRHNLAAFEEQLRTTSPPKSLAFLLDEERTAQFRPGFEQGFVEHVSRGVRQVMSGDLLDGVRALKGCGLGLTPSGDDFIAGYLIGLNLLQQLRGQDCRKTADVVFQAARSGNVFSNSFLDLARRGLLFGRMKDLILALVRGGEGAVRVCTGKLLAIGGSSGADLGTGFFMTVRGEMGVS